MSDVVWEDPPEKRNRHGVWIERLTPVMARTDQWARIDEQPDVLRAERTVSSLRRKKVKMPDGKWDFRHGVVDEKHYIYARFLGAE